MKINPTFLESILFLLTSMSIYIWVKYGKRIKKCWKALRKKYRKPPQLKLKSPEACPLCATGFHRFPHRCRNDIVLWSELKSASGRKKRFDTTGYYCANIDYECAAEIESKSSSINCRAQ